MLVIPCFRYYSIACFLVLYIFPNFCQSPTLIIFFCSLSLVVNPYKWSYISFFFFGLLFLIIFLDHNPSLSVPVRLLWSRIHLHCLSTCSLTFWWMFTILVISQSFISEIIQNRWSSTVKLNHVLRNQYCYRPLSTCLFHKVDNSYILNNAICS